MTNSYAIIRRILVESKMTPAEKLVGVAYAIHLNRHRGEINVRQATIAREVGFAQNVLSGAVAKMVKAGIVAKIRRGNRLVLSIRPVDKITDLSVKESVDKNNDVFGAATHNGVEGGDGKSNLDEDQDAILMDANVGSSTGYNGGLDTEFSSRAEELFKIEEERARKERERISIKPSQPHPRRRKKTA